MLPSDLDQVVTVGQPSVSPDGRRVAFVVVRADADSGGYRSQVWLVAADGSTPPLPFTSGEHRDGNPRWSPDGTRLAFTSDRDRDDDVRATLHVAPVGSGGEVVTVGRFRESVGWVRWSPDGAWLAFVTRTQDPRYAEEETKRGPQRVRHLYSRLDNEGPVSDRRAHVHVVPADGSARPRDLTPGPFELGEPAWTPDSAALVVSGPAHDDWDLDNKVDLHVVDVATGERRTITGTTGIFTSPAVSPDGSRVAFTGHDDAATYPHNVHVGVRPLDGTGGHTWVSTALDRTFTPYPPVGAPVWLDDDVLLAAAEDRGDVRLYAVRADGAEAPRALIDGPGGVTGLDAAGGTTAYTLTTETRPGEVYVLDEGGPRRLTDVTRGFAEAAQLRASQRLVVPSTDGEVELDAWLLLPPGEVEPGRRLPLLLNVHGGPFTQYGNRFFDEVQMQARAGYAVLWSNPRGSSGREEAFGRAICGEPLGGTGWGSVDYDDVIAVLDHALAHHEVLDPDRVGILGGSYGGFITSWAVTHTDRFRAACSERAANNLLSLEYASDAAGAFRSIMGASHVDDPDLYRRHSPITYVKECRTPLLILHSEGDLRTPVEQADQLFTALRLLRRDVEMVRFSGESHDLSRSGTPAHRRQRMEIILEFFGRHLTGAPPPSGASSPG